MFPRSPLPLTDDDDDSSTRLKIPESGEFPKVVDELSSCLFAR
jgi:hypothetical protein